MLKDTVNKIESAIDKINTIEDRKKHELIELLGVLKNEIGQLHETHGEHAKSIAGFAEIAAHEAARQNKSPDLQKLSIEGLSSSVKGFEVSHPKLVDTVNEICVLLSRIGI